jgi:hypothetical protein
MEMPSLLLLIPSTSKPISISTSNTFNGIILTHGRYDLVRPTIIWEVQNKECYNKQAERQASPKALISYLFK